MIDDLFSIFLFILDIPMILLSGGGLKLYSYKKGFCGFSLFSGDSHSIRRSSIELSKEVPFEDNLFISILNGINSVHDVAPLFNSASILDLLYLVRLVFLLYLCTIHILIGNHQSVIDSSVEHFLLLTSL